MKNVRIQDLTPHPPDVAVPFVAPSRTAIGVGRRAFGRCISRIARPAREGSRFPQTLITFWTTTTPSSLEANDMGRSETSIGRDLEAPVRILSTSPRKHRKHQIVIAVGANGTTITESGAPRDGMKNMYGGGNDATGR